MVKKVLALVICIIMTIGMACLDGFIVPFKASALNDSSEYCDNNSVCSTSSECEHIFGPETVVSEPTCEAKGLITRTCIECGYQEEISTNPLGHNVTIETNDGIISIICSRCEIAETLNYISCVQNESVTLPLSTDDYVLLIQPTITGYYDITFSADKGVDGFLFSEKLQIINYSYCCYQTNKCISNNYLEAGAKYIVLIESSEDVMVTVSCRHSVSQWVQTVSPTCSTSGSKKGICSVCGEIVEESVPQLAHTFVDKRDDEQCTVEKECLVCGYIDENSQAILIKYNTPTETVLNNGEISYTAFIPDWNGKFVITSYCETDVNGYLYDSDFKLVVSDDGISNDNIFVIKAKLEKGKTYYIGSKADSDDECVNVISVQCYHNIVGGTIEVEPDCEKAGWASGICEYCGEKTSGEIEPTGHSIDFQYNEEQEIWFMKCKYCDDATNILSDITSAIYSIHNGETITVDSDEEIVFLYYESLNDGPLKLSSDSTKSFCCEFCDDKYNDLEGNIGNGYCFEYDFEAGHKYIFAIERDSNSEINITLSCVHNNVISEFVPINNDDYIAYEVETCLDCNQELSRKQVFCFGSYPQQKVDSTALINSLNVLSNDLEWNSIGQRYTDLELGTIDKEEIFICDVIFENEKYRGIKAWSCRSDFVKENLELDIRTINGYRYGETYWFKYEPLTWDVFDEESGLMVCREAIDATPFYDVIMPNMNSLNYTSSYIRQWLNEDFYNTAFTDEEKSIIQNSDLNNHYYSVNDKVVVLTSEEYQTYYSSIFPCATDYAIYRGATALNYNFCKAYAEEADCSYEELVSEISNYYRFNSSLVVLSSDGITNPGYQVEYDEILGELNLNIIPAISINIELNQNTQHKVKFSYFNGQNETYYYPGDTIQVPDIPDKPGYIFKEWYPEVPETMPDNDVEFIAVYDPILYTATFVCEGNVVDIVTYTVETESLDEPSVPALPFKLNGRWSEYDLSKGGDISIEAIYETPTTTLPSSMTVMNGESKRLIPSSNFKVQSQEWYSDDTSVAIVDLYGNITAISDGECYIKLICYGKDDLGNEIKSSDKVLVKVVTQTEPVTFQEWFRQQFDNFFRFTLHDLINTFVKVFVQYLLPYVE